MAGFGYIYTLYGIVLLLEILFIYRPAPGNAQTSKQGLDETHLLCDHCDSDDVSPRSLELDHKIINFLAAIGIPMACARHGYGGLHIRGCQGQSTAGHTAHAGGFFAVRLRLGYCRH